MWVLLGPGDACMVPSPSYPIHIWGPLFAGAAVREVPMTTGANDEGQLLERITVRVRALVAAARR